MAKKEISKKKTLEELMSKIKEIEDVAKGFDRAREEKKAGGTLYDKEQLEDVFSIDEVKKPYIFAKHKKTGVPVIIMKYSAKPELYKIYKTGRQALQKKGVRYSKAK